MGKKQYLTEDAKWGYLLIAPTIIGLIVLNVYPFLPVSYTHLRAHAT